MNKPNEKQRAIIKFFLKQLSFWENTNDINSPTHLTDIGEESYYLNDHLSPETINDVEHVTVQMYQVIRNTGPFGF
jgi:hypothetical protein